MKSVKELIEKPVSPYTGSKLTHDLIAAQIKERWGEKEVEKYNPYTNALTFRNWAQLGYQIKKGEKALRSITFIEKKDAQGNIVKKIKRTVPLFYYLQVTKNQNESNNI